MPTVPDIHRRGTRADQATIAAPPLTVGTLYFVTDEGVTERWTGAAWESYSGGAGELGFYQLTGDVTAGPGVGTQAATIAPGAVTYAKLQDVSAASRLLGRGSAAGAGDVEEITLGTNLSLAGTTLHAAAGAARIGAVGLVIDGGGSALTTGVKGDLYIPFACTVTASTLIADVSGSVVLDLLLSASYATTPTVSIVASAPPTLSSALTAQDATLTGWTVSVAAGSRLRVSVTSASTITRLTHTLTVQAT